MTSTDAAAGPPEAASTPKRRRRRWPWLVLGALVVLVIGLRVALPVIVERGAAYGSRYWLGLPARIDNADFDLVEGIVVLEGVSVGREPDGVAPNDAALEPPIIDPATALLHFDRISAHLSWKDLRESAVRLTDIKLEAPSVRVEREADGRIDPLRRARPLAPPAEEDEEPEEPSQPWPIAVDRFALAAPNVVIVDPPTGQNLLEFSLESFGLDRVAINGSDFSLGGVGVEGPVLRVRRDLVLSRPAPAAAKPATPAPSSQSAAAAPVAVPPASTPAAPAAASAAAPPGYRIEKIDIARATFTWVTDSGPLDVALALKASDITADEGKRFPVDLQLDIAKGHVSLSGQVGVLPPSYSGKLAWNGLPFPPLLLASLPEIAAWLRSADSTADLQLDVDVAGANGPPSIRMSGHATVSTLAIADPGDKEVACGFKELEVAMKEVLVPLPEAGKPPRTTIVNLDLFKLTEPTIRYTHPSPSLYALMGITPAKPADQAPAKETKAASAPAKVAAAKGEPTAPATVATDAPPVAAPVDVSIASVELVAGDLEVTDTTVTPPVTSTVKDLFVSARNLHVPDASAQAIKVRAVLPKTSALTIQGELRPGNNGDFTVSLQTLDLPVFSSYAMMGGASLDAGQASVKTTVKLRGKTVELNNDLVLKKLGVSLRDPSTFDRSFGMPIDLVLALLRDPAGDIRLKIPVKIGEKGTEVSTGAIIASAMKAALVGALTSPLKLLGGVFDGAGGAGGGGFGVAPIRCDAGSAEPVASAASRMDDLAKLLADRPAMGLVLRGRTSAEDRPILAGQVLVERVKADKGLPDVEDTGFLARRRITQALRAADKSGVAVKGPPEGLSAEDKTLYDRMIAAVEVPADRFASLATARAARVRELLVARKVDGARVAIGEREADGEAGVVISLAAR